MKVIQWAELSPADVGPRGLAAAVGVFDGLHEGHLLLLREVLARDGYAKGLVTFRDNPKEITVPAAYRGDLFSLDQKLERLTELGFDLCVLIDFSGDFSKLPGRKFLSLLRDRGDLRFLALGADFRCGYRLDTGAAELVEYCGEMGVETRLLEPLLREGRPVSSSRIRNAIGEGRLDEARAMLGRDYELDLRRSRRESQGTEIRVRPACGQVNPPPGAYEAIVRSSEGTSRAIAVLDGDEWTLKPPVGGSWSAAPEALRLLNRVSRE